MSLGLQEGAGVTPQAQPPTSAAPGHTHLLLPIPRSPTHIHLPSCPRTCTLGPSQQPELRNLLCLHSVHLFYACALTAPLCTSKEGCVHTHSLVHSCSHFLVHFCLCSVPLTKCLCSCVFFSTALSLPSFFFPLTRELF